MPVTQRCVDRRACVASRRSIRIISSRRLSSLGRIAFSRRGRRIRNILDALNADAGNASMSIAHTRILLPPVIRRIRLDAFGGGVGLVAVLVSGTGFWIAAAAVGRASIKMETNEVGRNEVLRWGRTRSLIYSPFPPTRYGLALSLSLSFLRGDLSSRPASPALSFVLPFPPTRGGLLLLRASAKGRSSFPELKRIRNEYFLSTNSSPRIYFLTRISSLR